MKVVRRQWDIASPVTAEERRRVRAEDEREEELSRPPQIRIDTRPLDRFSQVESRARRLKGLDVHYNDTFDLVCELDSILRPFTARVGELTLGPLGMRNAVLNEVALRPEVDAIAAAVHGLRILVTEMLAGWRSLPADGRSRLAAVVREPAHGCAPVVSDAEMSSGEWVDRMTAHVELLSVDLATLLGKSPAPGGFSSAESQELRAALREVDYAVSALERRIRSVRAKAEAVYRARRAAAADPGRRERERAMRALARLGLNDVPREGK